MPRSICVDGEGPNFKNDNAYEVFSDNIQIGTLIYSMISTMDDLWSQWLSQEEKERIGVPENYENGGTLRVILPFLKARGVTQEYMRGYGVGTLKTIRDAKTALSSLSEAGDVFLVSASYEPAVTGWVEKLDSPFKKVYCTELNIDKEEYKLSNDNITTLRRYEEEMRQMVSKVPVLENPKVNRIADLPGKDREIAERLSKMFWGEIYNMEGSRQMIDDVKVVGGEEKVNAVIDSLKITKNSMEDVMFCGDSMTDWKALKAVRDAGGLAVSFNGGYEPVEVAEVGVLSYSMGWAVVGEAFLKYGKETTVKLVKMWEDLGLRDALRGLKLELNQELVDCVLSKDLPEPTTVCYLDDHNREEFGEMGKTYRKRVRKDAGAIR